MSDRSPEHADESWVRRVLDVGLRLGDVLLSSQAGTADVAATIVAVTGKFGLANVQVNITADSITVSVPRGVAGAPVTAMWLVSSRTLDYTRLASATELVQDIIVGHLNLDEVETALGRLVSAAHPHPPWVSTVALGGMAAGFSLLLGAGALVVLVAGLTTSAIDRVARMLSARRVPLLFQQVVGALIATGVTLGLDAAGRLPAGAGPSLVVAANIAVLLSGLATVGSIQDAITGYHLTATARIVEILLSAIGLWAGVILAVRVGVFLGVDVAVSPDIPVALVSVPTRVVAGVVGAGAAALASYAPPRAVAAAATAGAAGSVLYLVSSLAGADPVSSSFLAALGIGLSGTLIARRLGVPSLVIAMAGIMPLVPGLSLYRGFVDLVTNHPMTGFSALGTAAATALALGAGVLLGPMLAPSIRRELTHLRRHPRQHNRRAVPVLAGLEGVADR